MTSTINFAIVAILCSAATSSVATLVITRVLDRRRLMYAAEGMPIVETRDSLDGLSVTHHGHSIERLTKSRIWLWNSGRKPIIPTDVFEANPLKASFPNAKILNLSVLEASEGALGFRPVDLGDGSWRIDFSHWDPKHGVFLEALHTSTFFVPKLSGSVNGLQPIHSVGRIERGAFLSKRARNFRRWAPLIALFLLAVGIGSIIELKLSFDIRSLLALFLLAPGEVMMILWASFWVNALSIPRGLRHLGSKG